MAEVIAVPGRLRRERRQAESLPDRSRVLHEFAFGQCDRCKRRLERCINEDGCGCAIIAWSARSVAGVLVRHDLEIMLRLAAIGHGPEQCIGIVRGDVLVNGNDPLAGKAMQRRGAVERAPDFALRRSARKLDRDHGIEAGERLMHGNPRHAFDGEDGAQVMQINRLHRHAPDDARLARGHLADERGEDCVAPACDRRDVHESVVFLQIDVAVGFSERGFGLQKLRIDQSFDDDLGLCRHQQVDRFCAHHVDRAAGERAGDCELVEIFRHLLHGRIGDDRRAADHHGARQRHSARLAFLPMGKNSRAQLDRRVHAQTARRLELAAVIADILNAGVRVLGNVMPSGKIRRIVETRRRDRHRQPIERRPVAVEIISRCDDLLARSIIDNARRNGMRNRFDPGLADFFQRLAEPNAINVSIGGEACHQHGAIETPAL